MPVSALEWSANERHAVNQSWCTSWGASSTYSRNARVTAKVGCHMGAILGVPISERPSSAERTTRSSEQHCQTVHGTSGDYPERKEYSTLDCPRLSNTVETSRLEPGGLSSAYQQERVSSIDGGTVERALFTAELWCVLEDCQGQGLTVYPVKSKGNPVCYQEDG